MNKANTEPDDEELHGCNFLIVGRTTPERHLLCIFDAKETINEALISAEATASLFPDKPIWVFRLETEMRAKITVECKASA